MFPRVGPIPTYAIFYLTGIILHFGIGYILARRLKLSNRIWIIAGICYALGMTIGAKILYDIQNSQFDLAALFTSEHYTKGGLWGGLLAYLSLAVPLVLVLSRQKLKALDLLAMTIPIPWTFAKLGCLFNGCCYGKACSLPWAITFPEGAYGGAPAGIPLHPTQIYEILITLIIMIVFITVKGDKWQGTKLLLFLILYGFGRAVTEMYRGDFDHHRYIGALTLSQLLCLIAAGISFALLIINFMIIYRRKLSKPET